MKFRWIATAAFGVALAPGVVLAQGETTTDTTKSKATTDTTTTTTTTSTGDVSTTSSNVTDAMIKAQDDPNLIGSPAWWKTHATADGKPLGAAAAPRKPE